MQRILIWDIPTRLFHWTLALSFALAWLTGESDTWLSLHVFCGYLMLGALAFRLIWGFAGSHYARFASFWFGPGEALAYLKQVLRGHATRHVGHNPAGSLAIYALLALTLAAGLTGILTLGAEEQHGLAAGWFGYGQARLLKLLHEGVTTAMLLVVLGHLAGVLVESWQHRENLARAMLTGKKLAQPETVAARPHGALAVVLGLLMLGFAAWWFAYAIDRQLDQSAWHSSREGSHAMGDEPHVKFVGQRLPDNAHWREECGSCHAVFYPSLLPARSWQAIMDGQAEHFGTDLALDAATTQAVLKFMLDNAADHHLTEAGLKIDQSVARDAVPLRITDTAYWIRKHREIAAADWANPLVKSQANCAACHSDADAGTYEDGAMQLPPRPTAPASAAAAAASNRR